MILRQGAAIRFLGSFQQLNGAIRATGATQAAPAFGWLTGSVSVNGRTRLVDIKSSGVLKLSALREGLTLATVSDAVVAARIVDRYGADVSGQSWPVSLAYVAGSDGEYAAAITNALALTRFAHYTAQVTATTPAGVVQYWECVFTAQAAGC